MKRLVIAVIAVGALTQLAGCNSGALSAHADTVAKAGSQELSVKKLSELLGQGVVVENKGGAGGNIAAQLVKIAAPNGYTLLVTSVAYAVNPRDRKSVV